MFARTLAVLSFLLVPLQAQAQSDMRFINDIPDFLQTSVTGAQHGDGAQYCAPAAVSNSLIWLAGNKGSQEEMVKTLAGPDYMNTSLDNGTDVASVLRAVDKLARAEFGNYKSLSYQGWRPHASSYAGGKTPDLNWLAAGVGEKRALWLNVGWYKKPDSAGNYQRIGGHWVTMVGYDYNGSTKKLVLHDPAPRAGKEFANEAVALSLLNAGMLTGNNKGLPVAAQGYIELGSGMHLKSGADLAIIDGAVRLELN